MTTVTTLPSADTSLDNLAREVIYRFLSAGFSGDPRRLLNDGQLPSDLEMVIHAADWLRDLAMDEAIPLGFGDLPPHELDARAAVALLTEDPASVQAEFVRVFGLIPCRDCPPYETEYLENDEPFFRAQHLADLAGFYRAFGMELSPERRDRPDFVATELEFAALLLRLSRLAVADDAPGTERRAICDDGYRSFLADHLTWWLPSFSAAVCHRAEAGYFVELARLLAAFLPVERQRLGIAPTHHPFHARATELPRGCEACR